MNILKDTETPKAISSCNKKKFQQLLEVAMQSYNENYLHIIAFASLH